MPSILGANSVSGYDVENSLRFDLASNADLVQTFASAGNRRTWTWSAWIKRSGLGVRQTVFHQYNATNNNEWMEIRYEADDKIQVSQYSQGIFTTTTKFRDPSAWTHLVLAVDTTQGTAANRVKLYVNGSLVTDVNNGQAAVYPDQNSLTGMNQDSAHAIGHYENNGNFNADFTITEVHSVDGSALAPTSFGETNENGVWVPIKYTGSYGTNGYFLEFQQTGTSANSSGIGADTSGNDHHFTPTNLAATDITTDTCTNNFATMNPIHVSTLGSGALPTFSEGNTKLAMVSDSSTSSTIAPSKGKWYVEYKQGENSADNGGYPIVGLTATLGGNAGDVIGFRTADGTNYRGQLGTTSVNNAFGSARSANDIFGFYINLDDEVLIVHKNGSDYMGSGASSGLDWSGGLTTTNIQTGFYHFYVQNNFDGSPAYTDEVNFGNAAFAISSSNSDANGYGSFEYSPTLSGTAFYSMCTKNLAEFG